MDNTPRSRRLLGATVFVVVCAAIMALRLMPHDMEPGGMPGPDLLFCVACAWMLRRPEQLPALLIAGVFLTADLLYQRPPGLWAALMVAAAEGLRARALSGRPLSFAAEWAWVTALCLGMTMAKWLLLGVTLVAQPDIIQWMLAAGVTALAYPGAVVLLRLLGVRRPDFSGSSNRKVRA